MSSMGHRALLKMLEKLSHLARCRVRQHEQKKRATYFATLLQSEFNSEVRVARFTTQEKKNLATLLGARPVRSGVVKPATYSSFSYSLLINIWKHWAGH